MGSCSNVSRTWHHVPTTHFQRSTGISIAPGSPEAESGSLDSGWIRRASGTNAPPRFTANSHMAKCRGRSNLQSCFHIKRPTIYLYLHPTGLSTCPAAHACVTKVFEWWSPGNKEKKMSYVDDIQGTTDAKEEVRESSSWVLKVIVQMGLKVNLNTAQLMQPQLNCLGTGTGETRRWIEARKVKLSVK